ncbi:MAG: hypothetical protein NTU58_02670 [Candidatus Nealsonbacteria bacterium]|nr:hypothetical protein [Candidatus Nealsonbacteria bacterium]
MNKKILIGIIAVVIVAVVIIAVIITTSFLKPSSKKQETNEPVQQKNEEIDSAALDESIKSTIESLKLTCADFLKGDLSGNPDSDCPGFDKSINKSLCLYCYAVKNQTPDLCGKIDNESALRTICQRATGTPIDEIID